MTAKKDLKRRVRERQARTGESYVAARRAVIEPPAIEVVEMDDVSELAAELGLRGRIVMARALAAQIDPREALVRLRDVALATSDDPAMETLRAVALRGERPQTLARSPRWAEELARFRARVRAGIGGVSEGGTVLALPLGGARGIVMMVCHLGFGAMHERSPAIVLTTADGAPYSIEAAVLRSLRR